MSQPQFLTLCGLLPFLAVSILHLLYASRCWHAYTRRGAWAGMLALNVLVLAPYANVLALPALLAWLAVAWCRCGGGGAGGVLASQPAPACSVVSEQPPAASLSRSRSRSLSLSLSLSRGGGGAAPSMESTSAASLDLLSSSFGSAVSVEALTPRAA